MMRWMLRALVVMALVSNLARAQDEGRPQEKTGDAPTAEELDRQVEELNRQHQKFLEQSAKTMRVLEASLIDLGTLEPWPAIDPTFEDSAAWREAVLAAPELSGAELLARCDEFGVRYSWLQPVLDVLPREDYLESIIQAVHLAGKRTHPAAPARVAVALQLIPVRMELAQQGLVDEVYHLIYCDSRLEVPARILRGDQVHYAQVAVEFSAYFQVVPGVAQRPALEQAVLGSIAGLFKKLEAKPKASGPLGGGWASWLADPAQTQDRQRLFQESFREEKKLSAGLENLAGLGAIATRYVGAEHIQETQNYRAEDLRSGWEECFRLWGIPVGLPDAPELMQVVLIGAVPGANQRQVGGLFSRVALRERDGLMVLGGEFVRVAGETYSANKAGIIVERAMNYGLDTALEDARRRLLEAIGRFGAPPLPPHPDAAAIAAYLRPKARVAVPEKALADLANRIAHRFAAEPGIPADLRASWIHNAGGERVFMLSDAGNARSGTRLYRGAKEAIDRVIDGLTLTDPLALWAFEQPWSTNYEYAVVLPEGYVDYFSRTRPGGKGALRQVQVLDAREMANRRMRRMDAETAAPLYGKLKELEPLLAGQKVLVCEYIPEDGHMSYTLSRDFWYRAAPRGWGEVAATLSADHPLKRVGPPRQTAPDYLREAAEANR